MRTITGYMKVDPMLRNEQRHGRVRSDPLNDLDVVIGVPSEFAIAIGFGLKTDFGTTIETGRVLLHAAPEESAFIDDKPKSKKTRGLNRVYLSPDGKHHELRIAAGKDHVRKFKQRDVELSSPYNGTLIVPIAMEKLLRKTA
jgi:hypothetical protein